LGDFLKENTTPFVESLFEAIENGSYKEETEVSDADSEVNNLHSSFYYLYH
jgi:hypothetical protein